MVVSLYMAEVELLAELELALQLVVQVQEGVWLQGQREWMRKIGVDHNKDPGEAAREALKWLTQGKKSVAKYKAKFEEHSSLTSWSKVDLRSHFYDGLADAIKDALVISDHSTEAYKSLVESVQVLDIHLRQCQAEKKGQTFHQTSSQSYGTEFMPIDIDASCQQQGGRQGQSAQKRPNCSNFLKKMKGKCFGCGSSDHTKEQGAHGSNICNHCKKAGHRSTVCFAKFMGREKVSATSQMQTDSN